MEIRELSFDLEVLPQGRLQEEPQVLEYYAEFLQTEIGQLIGVHVL